jgi:hypothetical protein
MTQKILTVVIAANKLICCMNAIKRGRRRFEKELG